METQFIVLMLASVIFVAVALKSVMGGHSPTPPRVEPRKLGGSSSHPREAEIRQLMVEGKKIPAIKLYREIHQCGLKEAKEAVEAMM